MINKTTHFILFAILATLFFSCSTKQSPNIDFVSEDPDFKIRCYGTKSVEFDPWKLNVAPVYKDSIYPGVEMEVYVDEPSQENISIEWLSSQRAVISVKEKDGSVKTLPISVEF
jgi:hypothetical protein